MKRYGFMKTMVGLLLLLMWGSTLPLLAQSSGDYFPDSPADPADPNLLLKYELTLQSNQEGAGTQTGGGTYRAGTNVTLKATTNTGYKFLYWTKDQSENSYSSSASFSYTSEARNVSFTAVYERLKVITAKCNYANVAAPTVTGGTSGRFSKGAKATLKAASNPNYVFEGWLKGDETEYCSTDLTYVYTVEEEDVVFTAVYQYQPGNPGDPTDGSLLVPYNITVSLSDPNAGFVSGNARKKYGEKVTVSTSPVAGYEFQYWNKKTSAGIEERFATTSSFTYDVEMQDVEFIAVYVNIAERLETLGHTLTLVCEPAGNGIFSIPSGQKYLPEDTYTVTFEPGTAVVFDGWYINGVIQANTLTFSGYMPDEDIALVAKCHYDPTNPDDPDNSLGYQEEVEGQDILGDVDGDGKVTMGDAITVMNVYLVQSENDVIDKKYDIDGDGKITMGDAIYVLNLYLNAQ